MENLDFLKRLLEAVGPSGFEQRPARIWAEEAKSFANVNFDNYGNVTAKVNAGKGPVVMLSGHMDEIGLMISHINDKGLAHIKGVGGWDVQVLPGQRVRFMTAEGDLIAVVGRKAIHLMKPEDRERGVKMEDIWVDFGLSAEETKKRVQVGDVGVLEQPVIDFGNGRIASKALDDRLGAFIVLEAARRLNGTCPYEVIAVASAQEEIGAHGAKVAAYALEPKIAIAVDVTHDSEQPGVDEQNVGVTPLGSGANIAVGVLPHSKLSKFTIETAEKHNIKYSRSAYARGTGTDGDVIIPARAGVPTAVLSIPLRYMHSPSELIDVADAQAVIDLIVHLCQDLPLDFDFARSA